MTKEQTIKFAECLKNNCAINFNDLTDFCDTVIKALEQQPSDDCVSRAEMLKYQQYLRGKMSNEENHKLWEFIDDLPPVTPTFPKGATNGDMIKAMLQIKDEDIKAKNSCVNNQIIEYVIDTDNYFLRFDNNFWNAPYKSDCIPSEYDLSEDIELSNPQMYR